MAALQKSKAQFRELVSIPLDFLRVRFAATTSPRPHLVTSRAPTIAVLVQHCQFGGVGLQLHAIVTFQRMQTHNNLGILEPLRSREWTPFVFATDEVKRYP